MLGGVGVFRFRVLVSGVEGVFWVCGMFENVVAYGVVYFMAEPLLGTFRQEDRSFLALGASELRSGMPHQVIRPCPHSANPLHAGSNT